MKKTLRILNVEDSIRDYELLQRHLVREGYDLISDRVETIESMKNSIERCEPDVILCDFSLPRFDAFSALKFIKEAGLDIPFIIISGTIGEEVAVEAMLAGAQDYIMKGKFARLIPAIERGLEEAKNRKAKKFTEEALKESEDRYRDLVENSFDVICTHDLDGQIVSVNRMACKLLGYRKEFLVGRNLRSLLLPKYREGFDDYLFEIQDKSFFQGTLSVITSSGEKRILEFTNTLRTEGVSIPIVRGVARDVTEQRIVEKALRESEIRYRLLFETNPFPMWVYDLESLYFLAVNQSAVKNYGYSTEEFLSKNINDIRISENAGEVSANDSQICKHRKKNGEIIDVEITSYELEFSGRKARLVLPHDVTERKKAEDALKKAEEKYRSIFENAVEGIFQINSNGDFISVNPAMARLLGYCSPNELIESKANIKTQHYNNPEIQNKLDDILSKDGIVIGFESEIYRKDKSKIWTAINIRSIYDEAHYEQIYEGSIEDITERKRIEQIQANNLKQTALRADVSSAFAEIENNLQEILQLCAQAVLKHLEAYLVQIWTISHIENALILKTEKCFNSKDIDTYNNDPAKCKFTTSIIADNRQVHISNDISDDVYFNSGDREWLQKEGIEGFAGVPLIVENRLVGVLAMFFDKKINEETIEALNSVKDLIAQGIDRKNTELALKESEEKLRQSQKLESIGQLAGGIAHDFNNLLTAITGYSELSLRRLENDDPLRRNLEEIRSAGERAAALTRQLLAFSRKQVLQPKILDVNLIVSDFEKMLQRLIGEDIELRTILKPQLGNIKADPGQIEQVIMNLVVNARDAMPLGGKLTIETENVFLNEIYAKQHIGVVPGAYIVLTVSDTGIGMDDETQKRIFDPFFTTKDLGKGTGLGLSTVYGIVKQSGGNVWVYSEINYGTTFKVYLPRVDEIGEITEPEKPLESEIKGTETILIAEDEDTVRKYTKDVLVSCGYVVLEAASGKEALLLCDEYEKPIQMLITDVVMPGLSGRELVDEVSLKYPNMKVLFMSGYTDNTIVYHGVLDKVTDFIQKPFSPDTLAQKVRQLLKAN